MQFLKDDVQTVVFKRIEANETHRNIAKTHVRFGTLEYKTILSLKYERPIQIEGPVDSITTTYCSLSSSQ